MNLTEVFSFSCGQEVFCSDRAPRTFPRGRLLLPRAWAGSRLALASGRERSLRAFSCGQEVFCSDRAPRTFPRGRLLLPRARAGSRLALASGRERSLRVFATCVPVAGAGSSGPSRRINQGLKAADEVSGLRFRFKEWPACRKREPYSWAGARLPLC